MCKLKHRKNDRANYPMDKIARINMQVQQIIAGNVSQSDPDGSYTGVPVHQDETPVQDADDL